MLVQNYSFLRHKPYRAYDSSFLHLSFIYYEFWILGDHYCRALRKETFMPTRNPTEVQNSWVASANNATIFPYLDKQDIRMNSLMRK